MKNYIYTIINPKNQIYIGKTENPKIRFQVYEGISRRKTDTSNSKINKSLIEYEYENHKIELIYYTDDYRISIFDIEQYFILKYRQGGWDLLNTQIYEKKLSKIYKYFNKSMDDGLSNDEFIQYHYHYEKMKEENMRIWRMYMEAKIYGNIN
jgi:hypothetical protein